ncbi:RHS repeat-associated core domain-containing protein [Candidatus Parcubacteria bacterium]|nr:MAG: RHS repeat-associated core domain-containing protein [Candidatus Parcubacteria bacterium]
MQVYHFDNRGSTVAITDAAGNVTDTFAYDPFGKLTNRTGTTQQPFTYNGRDGVMDDGNGLYFMRTRYFDAELMRFISKDVVIGFVKRTQSVNRFAYVEGNPINRIDATGQWFWESDNTNYSSNSCGYFDCSPAHDYFMNSDSVGGSIYRTIYEYGGVESIDQGIKAYKNNDYIDLGYSAVGVLLGRAKVLNKADKFIPSYSFTDKYKRDMGGFHDSRSDVNTHRTLKTEPGKGNNIAHEYEDGGIKSVGGANSRGKNHQGEIATDRYGNELGSGFLSWLMDWRN